MPIHDMLYRCPRCGHDPLSGYNRSARCASCGTSFHQGRGGVINVRPPEGPPEQSSASALMAAVERVGGPGSRRDLNQDRAVKSPLREARIAFGTAEGHDVIRFRGEVLGFSERISWKAEGLLRMEEEALTFKAFEGPDGLADEFECKLNDIRGVQISSRALQVTLAGPRLYQFFFVADSPKRWEDLLCLALTRLYARSGQCINEFKPRLVLSGP